MEINKVAVLGAGQMGLSIAQIAAQVAECEVYLYDIKKDALKNAIVTIKRNLQTCVDKGKMTAAEVNKVTAKIHPVFDLEAAVKVC